MIFVIFIYYVVDVLLYSQCCIANKDTAQMSYDITVAYSFWARSSTFKMTIIGNNLCCFTPVYSFLYPLKVCSDKNDNDPSRSLIGSFLKYLLNS